MAVKMLAGGHGRLLFSAGDRRKREEQKMEGRAVEDKKECVCPSRLSRVFFFFLIPLKKSEKLLCVKLACTSVDWK